MAGSPCNCTPAGKAICGLRISPCATSLAAKSLPDGRGSDQSRDRGTLWVRSGLIVPRLSSMKKLTVVALAILTAAPAAVAQQSPLTLWYDKPAVLWTDALPVGNGHMGAMIFGGASRERIQFNEHTVWTGEPHDYAHKGAAQSPV